MGVMAVGVRRLVVGVSGRGRRRARLRAPTASPRSRRGSSAAASCSIADHPWQVAIVSSTASRTPFDGPVLRRRDRRRAARRSRRRTASISTTATATVERRRPGRTRRSSPARRDLGGTGRRAAQRVEHRLLGWRCRLRPARPDAGPYDAALATLADAARLPRPGDPRRRCSSAVGLTRRRPERRRERQRLRARPRRLPHGSPQLRATDLFAVERPRLRRLLRARTSTAPTMLCAIAPGSDSCNGDSGGR